MQEDLNVEYTTGIQREKVELTQSTTQSTVVNLPDQERTTTFENIKQKLKLKQKIETQTLQAPSSLSSSTLTLIEQIQHQNLVQYKQNICSNNPFLQPSLRDLYEELSLAEPNYTLPFNLKVLLKVLSGLDNQLRLVITSPANRLNLKKKARLIKLFNELPFHLKCSYLQFLDIFLQLCSVYPGCYEFDNSKKQIVNFNISLPNDENLIAELNQSISQQAQQVILDKHFKQRFDKLYDILVKYVQKYHQEYLEQEKVKRELIRQYESIKCWHPLFQLDQVPSPKLRASDNLILNMAKTQIKPIKPVEKKRQKLIEKQQKILNKQKDKPTSFTSKQKSHIQKAIELHLNQKSYVCLQNLYNQLPLEMFQHMTEEKFLDSVQVDNDFLKYSIMKVGEKTLLFQ